MRKIDPLLKSVIDNHMPPDLGVVPTPQQMICLAASALVGITEKDHPEIVNLIRSTVTKPWGEAWCDDFVQTCIAYVEASLGVQSSIVTSEGVLDTWTRSKAYSAASPAKIGDMILWQLEGTTEGHCGIITGMDSLRYQTIEGNTSDSESIDRMGRGIFAKNRAKGGSKTFIELGFLRCFS